jgi:hypothetical protein
MIDVNSLRVPCHTTTISAALACGLVEKDDLFCKEERTLVQQFYEYGCIFLSQIAGPNCGAAWHCTLIFLPNNFTIARPAQYLLSAQSWYIQQSTTEK